MVPPRGVIAFEKNAISHLFKLFINLKFTSMFVPFLNELDLNHFSSRVFSIYLKGFGSRSVYYNGPVGTMLHACYIYRSSGSRLVDVDVPTVYLSFTDAHHRNIALLGEQTAVLDFRYQRKPSIRSLFRVSSLICALQAVEVAIRLRTQLRGFEGNKWVHILAAGFQVAAGIQMGRMIAKSEIETVIWGSDHCVVTRTAIIANKGTQKHHWLPHGPSIGKTNKARDRSLFGCVHALNAFQKAVLLKWEPSLTITLLKNSLAGPTLAPASVENKPLFLFLNQLDLGLKPDDGFSFELEQFLSLLNPAELLGIVVKDRQQLNKFCSRLKPPKQYLGLEQFMSSYPPGGAVCAVFSSGVSMDLMLAGYDLALSPNNSLVEDDKARQLLDIPDPATWKENYLYPVQFNVDDLENLHAPAF